MCASERKIGRGEGQCALADKFQHFLRYWAGGTIRQIDLVQQAQQFLVRDILLPQRMRQLAGALNVSAGRNASWTRAATPGCSRRARRAAPRMAARVWRSSAVPVTAANATERDSTRAT